MSVFLSHSPEETLAFAGNFAKSLQKGDTVLLDGEMGAGKTVFCKGVLRGLGVTCEVTSPTYAYINSYDDQFFHFDCYRVASEEQALSLGFADYFDSDAICLVEWSENIAGLLPERCKRVVIRKTGEDTREIEY